MSLILMPINTKKNKRRCVFTKKLITSITASRRQLGGVV